MKNQTYKELKKQTMNWVNCRGLPMTKTQNISMKIAENK
jgi:hypothetical protein